ncbi:dihydroorotate dehydrogenase (fumarate) [Weissella uvarum]|uniref:dihydroorotate oxidase n=1 Tax=Weissella uvarum TaxID=1479233 RepID=UPI0019611DDA|nr:dihydroorotate oxidase [Weissella uvarum]MBM7617158.1 dihydroorotate dehydrogenase (fumarate) [Weissella uvarum]MCM0595454.1 dihydroorotate oxidase [Weissella uvarum]
MTSMTASIANFTFNDILLNAAGVYCQTDEELDQILKADGAGSLVTKSATPIERAGNPGVRYADMPLGSINSMGLPNLGLDYYLDYTIKHQSEKPLFLSIAGLSKADNLNMLKEIQASDFNGLVELNLSCPNVPGKPQTGYDFETTAQILEEAFAFFDKPLGVKLPPYFDIAHFDMIAKILNQFPLAFVNTINSIGNAMMVDPETDTAMIAPKGGFGGIGGAIAKPTALANVRALRQRLNPEIKIIGTGGVKTGRDVYDLILCGADLVSVGTTLHQEGPQVFGRLKQELADEMSKKNYTDVTDFRGQLQTLA